MDDNATVWCNCPDTNSTAYPWKWINILTLKTTSSLSLQSVNYSDSIRSLWFFSLLSPPKMAWCRCLIGTKWHSSAEVSGVILMFVFVTSWGSGVLSVSLWEHYCHCTMDKANTRSSISDLQEKRLKVILFAFPEHLWTPSPLQPGSPCLKNHCQ